MTTIQVSKKTIIKALQKESLKQGDWIFSKASSLKENCKVCAVGAVLRNVLDPKESSGKLCSAAHKAVNGVIIGEFLINLALESKNYMGALSAYFESLPRQNRNKRRLLISFVEKNFPAIIQFDIDGAIPKKGVKVIS